MRLKNILGLLLFLPTLAFCQKVNIPDGWSDAYAFANGIRIHYYRAIPQPGKPVMVMVHGVTDNGLCWATLAEKLQERFDIYMLDARGHGLSDPFTNTDNGETLVKDVVEFVKGMKLQNPILVGHSMGAATVMRVGAEYPTIGSAIIMLDPLLRARSGGPSIAARGVPDRNPQAQKAAPAGTPNNRLSVSMFGNPETLVSQNNYSFEDLVATGHRQNPLWGTTDVQYWALSKKQYHGPYTAEASQAMTGTMNIGNSLTKINVPAIILKADASPEVRKSNDEAAAVMPKGKLIHMDGAGHNLHHDKLQQTTDILLEFLSSLKNSIH
ncbi:alpha/beta fold hydrolase [Desertivirga brevis]|uniref:alpha/beta fold hydrolase n=1 Tax=Desertivirga brevis TaxID=2810310 RepID=UPI001A96D2DE|nr:alpha/beta hydrolase [Pedobacter sp. SYSU D00873]